MTPEIENLREMLEARDLSGFLSTYRQYREQKGIDPVVTYNPSIIPTRCGGIKTDCCIY
jgi:hypothetical protein